MSDIWQPDPSRVASSRRHAPAIRKITINFFFLMTSQGFSVLISIIMLSIIARNLSISQFGLYGLITSVITVLIAIPYGGLSRIIEREIAKDQMRTGDIVFAVLGIRIALSIICFGLIILFVRAIGSFAPYTKEVLFASLWLVFCPLASTFSEVFIAYERMHFEALFNIIYKILIIVFILIFFKMGMGLAGVFLAKALAKLVQLLASGALVMIKFVKPIGNIDFNFITYLFFEGLPLEIAELSRMLYFRIDEIFLGMIKGKAEVGIFHGPFEIIQGISLIPLQIMHSAFPAFSRLFKKAREEFLDSYYRGFKYIIMLGVPFALGIFYYSKEIVHLVLGTEFVTSIIALKILSLGIFLMFPEIYIQFILTSIGKQIYYSYSIVLSVIIRAFLNLASIPILGFKGACLSSLGAQLAFVIFSYTFLSRELGQLKLDIPYLILKPAIAGAGMILFWKFIFNHFHFILALMLGFVIYMSIIFLIRALSREELLLIKDIFQWRAKPDSF